MRNSIPHETSIIITYPCHNLDYTMLVNGNHANNTGYHFILSVNKLIYIPSKQMVKITTIGFLNKGDTYIGIADVKKYVVRHMPNFHNDDVIKWKYFPRYWPFVRGIHRSPVNSPHKGQ